MGEGGRIGKVRMKDTGFEFRIVDGPSEPEHDPRATLLRHAREIAEYDGLQSFVILGVFDDGKTTTGWRWADDCVIPRSLVPAWLAEVARRELITDVEAAELFDSKFEWVES